MQEMFSQICEVANSLGSLTDSIITLVSVLVAVGTSIYSIIKRGNIKKLVNAIDDGDTEVIKESIKNLSQGFKEIAHKVDSVVDTVSDSIEDINESIEDIGESIDDIKEGFND